MLAILRKYDAVLLSCGLATAWLLLSLHGLLDGVAGTHATKVTDSVIEQVQASGITLRRIAIFGASVLALHTAWGLLVWGLSTLTNTAFGISGRLRLATVCAWFALLTGLAVTANAELFPWSRASSLTRSVITFLAMPVAMWPLLAGLSAMLLAASIGVLVRESRKARHLARVSAWIFIATLVVFLWGRLPIGQEHPIAGNTNTRPNIILIGIDSLRPDVVGSRQRMGYTPSLSRFVEQGHVFEDATTPLARTFPSWMALMTGQRPVTSGVRENLIPRSGLAVETITQQLREAGYRTIYATDEVRFANIDESYGFDTVLTPRIGASDFVLGTLNDFPLTNLVSNSSLAAWLFADTYANRAAAVTYDPDMFLRRIDRGIEASTAPTLAAFHLTLPHWPYRWRADDDEVFSDTADISYAYLASVVEVDRQFSGLVRLLERKGLLRNAVVVVFSDHGEALNLPSDRLLKQGFSLPGMARWMSGHGTSVLSASQFQIFLAIRRFDVGGGSVAGGAVNTPVSIEDIGVTALDAAGELRQGSDFDGLSLLSVITGPGKPPPMQSLRVRFTESAYSTPSLRQGVFDEQSIVAEGGAMFRVSPKTGWVEMRMDMWSELMAVRERAAIGSSLLLAAVPAAMPGRTHYVLVPRAGGDGRVLHEPPDKTSDAEAALLWEALRTEYGPELGDPEWN